MTGHWRGLGSFGTVGLEIVVAIVMGLLVGRWADGKLQTAPYLTISGFALGLVVAGKAVYRSWKEMQRETEREEREQGNPAPILDFGDDDRQAKEDRASPVPPSPEPSSPTDSPKDSNEQP